VRQDSMMTAQAYAFLMTKNVAMDTIWKMAHAFLMTAQKVMFVTWKPDSASWRMSLANQDSIKTILVFAYLTKRNLAKLVTTATLLASVFQMKQSHARLATTVMTLAFAFLMKTNLAQTDFIVIKQLACASLTMMRNAKTGMKKLTVCVSLFVKKVTSAI
jgi:hypothetical protein